MRQVWTYFIKHSVKSESRNYFDGYPLTGKGIQYAKYYSPCDSQHEFNIFLSLYTSLGYIIMAYDAINT